MEEYRALRQHLTAHLVQQVCRLHQVETDRRRVTNLLSDDLQEQAALRENDVALAKLAEEKRQQVVAIRVALTRLAEGVYGICRTCGAPIAPQRLAAFPYAPQCLACATQAEQEARNAPRVGH